MCWNECHFEFTVTAEAAGYPRLGLYSATFQIPRQANTVEHEIKRSVNTTWMLFNAEYSA